MALPDTFTGSNGTLLTAYDALWLNHPSYSSGVIEIQSNRAKARNIGTTGAVYYNSAPASADYDVSAIVNYSSTTNNTGGVCGRMSSGANTFYHARIFGTDVQLYKFVAGTATLLGSAVPSGITTGVDAVLTLSMSGSTIRVLIDGVQKISVTDTAITAAGYAGLRYLAGAINLAMDNFDFAVAGGGSLAAQATGGATASGSATLAAQIAIAAVGVSVAGGNALAGVTVPLSATGLSVASGTAEASATVSISAAAIAQAAGAAGLSADVLLAGAGAAQASGNAELAIALAAMADGAATASGAGTLSVNVALQAVGGASAAGSADGSLSSGGAAAAHGGASAGGWASWSALVSVTAAGFANAMGAGQLAIEVPLSALGGASASGNALGTLLGANRNFMLEHAVTRLTRLRCTALASVQADTDVSRLTRLTHGVKHG